MSFKRVGRWLAAFVLVTGFGGQAVAIVASGTVPQQQQQQQQPQAEAQAQQRQPAPAKSEIGAAPQALVSPKAVSLSYLEGQVPMSPESVGTLGPDLFGDKVNFFNGSLTFEQTDLNLPGNSALPVAIARAYRPGRDLTVISQHGGQFGDWDLDVPRVSGTFSSVLGWVNSSGTVARCSGFSLPPPFGNISGIQYHQGVHMTVPGEGAQELLLAAPGFGAAPQDGRSYVLVTKQMWQVACLPALLNAPGEGFLAVSPNGVRYRFDWMASRLVAGVSLGSNAVSRAEYFLMATEVTDRFGNWVRYGYDSSNPMLLTSITSSDGRVIRITNQGGLAVAATDGTRTVQYVYSGRYLQNVVLPDGGRWHFALTGLSPIQPGDPDSFPTCNSPGTPPADDLVGTMTHPSGAIGTFRMAFGYHGRTYVERICRRTVTNGVVYEYGAVFPRLWFSQMLVSKTITGPGLGVLTWGYEYGAATSGWLPCTGCADRKTVRVTEPDGGVKGLEFGIRWRVNEGLLLAEHEGWTGSSWRKTTRYRYRSPAGQVFPDQFGQSILHVAHSDWLAPRNRPLDQRVVTLDGATFTWQADDTPDGFDGWARPLRVTKSSSVHPQSARTEQTAYYDHTGLWVLGQVHRVTEVTSGRAVEVNDYHPTLATLQHRRAFDLRLESHQYYADGTLYATFDAGGKAMWFGDWRRGQPGYVTFADGTQERQQINNLGKPDWRDNAAGTRHQYRFDAMGRLSRVDFPAESWGNYHPTTVQFGPVATEGWGMPAGHWRQHIVTGNSNTYRVFDALWRERVKLTWDAADYAGTLSAVETRYDAAGRKSFVSYPTRSFIAIDQPALPGTRFEYDALGRQAAQVADSELGALTTTTQYLPVVFQRRVTNPRGEVTTYAYQAWDTPTEDYITQIWAPESVNVTIERDRFGKALAVHRGGMFAGATVSASRRYVYDQHQRLCKTIEPEAGATVQFYDGSNNIAWRASGLNLPNTANCNHDAVPETAKLVYGYDLRDRLTSITYGDRSPGISRSYTADGLPETVASAELTWTYRYNNRRLLTSEWLSWPWQTPGQGWNFTWVREPHGHVAALWDPWGQIDFAPNALGQPTRAGSYATNARYHPNGALAGFSYGNGIQHTSTQNARGLPARWTEPGVADERYAYDRNGNVTAIDDLAYGLHRSMPWYDGLDRLRQANGPWGAGSFEYDALDNLRSSTVGGRNLVHRYDANNRLSALEGSQNITIGYDANGNVAQRGNQSYGFDLGNRLRNVHGRASYQYDGHGRRHWVARTDNSARLSAYDLAGKLRFSWDSTKGHTRYVYLGDRLVAENGEVSIAYVHTDLLGSPVARSDGARNVTERTRYEPYGGTVAGSTQPTGVGFTGHVNDADTGLVYMQQRYYDPIAGRFLSVDPVVADAGNGALFNRYMYAANNPLTMYDPDGRCTGSRITNSDGTCKSTGGFTTGSDGMAQGMQRVSAMVAAAPSPAAGAPSSSPASAESLEALASFLDRLVNGECGKSVNCGTLPVGGIARLDPGRIAHIFRNAPGHVNPVTTASQTRFALLFERTASNPANLRIDAVAAGIITKEAANAGVQAFTQTMRNGQQVWVTVRNGVIQNAGINPVGAAR